MLPFYKIVVFYWSMIPIDKLLTIVDNWSRKLIVIVKLLEGYRFCTNRGYSRPFLEDLDQWLIFIKWT